jgi:hypothetical protein
MLESHRCHHYYTLFATISEFFLVFCLHFLLTLHVTMLALSLAAATFIVYTAVTACYLRYNFKTLKNLSSKSPTV